MPTPLDSDLQKVLAMIIGATAEFSFAEGAATAALAGTPAYPYQDFGQITVMDMDNVPETQPRIVAVRGTRRQKGTEPTLAKNIYKLTMNEADALKLGLLYSATDGGALLQDSNTAEPADALDFSAAPSIPGHWYDLRLDGARVREVESCAIATLAEGVDFVVDYRLGRIRFITVQSVSRTPTIALNAITATGDTGMRQLTPMAKSVRSGYGRLVVFDKRSANNVVLDHQDFSCDIVLESGPGGQDGQAAAAIVAMVTVTSDVGTVLVRD